MNNQPPPFIEPTDLDAAVLAWADAILERAGNLGYAYKNAPTARAQLTALDLADIKIIAQRILLRQADGGLR